LEDLLIAIRLAAFTQRAKRQLINYCKFYYFDTGVYRTLRPTGTLHSSAEIDGPAPETLILQELQTVNDYLSLGYEIFFCRTKHRLEVDFVLYGARGLITVEIKRSATVSSADLRGLKAFR
jgi:predicted AAA+ superfamily ATPase